MQWENRILESGERPAADFLAHPFNWRIHTQLQQQVVEGLLDELGWIQRVTVNRRTGRIVNGHLRVTLALRRGDDTPVPYDEVDLDETEEALALASLDSSTALALPDPAQVREVIAKAEADSAAVRALLDDMAADAATLSQAGLASTQSGLRAADRPARPATVKIVVAVPDVALIEAAIKATGERNRAAALVTICAAYLGEGHGEATG